jgi:DNA-binding NtrC family response regulator
MHILIVEDDLALRTVWEHALEDAGHSVVLAATSNDAMRVLLTGRFDLIVLDVMVGDNNALSLTDYITYDQPETPVLVVTGSGFFPNGEVTKLAPNIDWFLRKPVPVSDFMAIVDHAHARAERRAAQDDGQFQPVPGFVGQSPV